MWDKKQNVTINITILMLPFLQYMNKFTMLHWIFVFHPFRHNIFQGSLG